MQVEQAGAQEPILALVTLKNLKLVLPALSHHCYKMLAVYPCIAQSAALTHAHTSLYCQARRAAHLRDATPPPFCCSGDGCWTLVCFASASRCRLHSTNSASDMGRRCTARAVHGCAAAAEVAAAAMGWSSLGSSCIRSGLASYDPAGQSLRNPGCAWMCAPALSASTWRLTASWQPSTHKLFVITIVGKAWAGCETLAVGCTWSTESGEADQLLLEVLASYGQSAVGGSKILGCLPGADPAQHRMFRGTHHGSPYTLAPRHYLVGSSSPCAWYTTLAAFSNACMTQPVSVSLLAQKKFHR